ncbi:MAG: hypothetical protein QY331_07695 [Melioribacteraceae bacterium]|nr:MAG: hypothetical protein QY331_07695 [Melioribacteraceae bacterium]
MKYLAIIKYYLLLLLLSVVAYISIYILSYLIIYSHYLLEANFSFIADVMKIMVGNIAYTSSLFLMVEVTAIMGSGYILGKVTDNLSYNNPPCGQAFIYVLATISIFFITVFFIMVFSETLYWFFDYLITILSPILFVLPFGANY